MTANKKSNIISRESWSFTRNTVYICTRQWKHLQNVITLCPSCINIAFILWGGKKNQLSWRRSYWELQLPTYTDVFYSRWPLMKWGLNRAFTVNKYSFYATASANPSFMVICLLHTEKKTTMWQLNGFRCCGYIAFVTCRHCGSWSNMWLVEEHPALEQKCKSARQEYDIPGTVRVSIPNLHFLMSYSLTAVSERPSFG